MFIIIFVFLILVILNELSKRSKSFCCFKSRLIGLFIRYRIFVMTKFIAKNRALLQFFADFFAFWLVFLWNNGRVIQYALSLIQPLRDRALTWAGGTELWDIKDWNELWIIFLYLSPYGRPNVIYARFRYALHISTICSMICFILYLVLINDMAKQHQGWKMLIGGISGIATWYAGYFMCSIIAKIPFFYKVLAFAAVVASNFAIFFMVLFIWTYFHFLDT